MPNDASKSLTTVFVIVATIVAIGIGYILLDSASNDELSDYRFWAWIAGVAVFFLGFLVLGLGWTGRLTGLLIDQRMKYSLSQLQLTAWTSLIIPAVCVGALSNVVAGGEFRDAALNLNMPTELWALMGISVAGLAGSQLIKGSKLSARPRTFAMNQTMDKAHFWNILEREEEGGEGKMDFGKLQMFFISAVLLFTYAVLLGSLFLGDLGVPPYMSEEDLLTFPQLDDAMLAILAISHAGYLTTKAASQPEATTPPAADADGAAAVANTASGEQPASASISFTTSMNMNLPIGDGQEATDGEESSGNQGTDAPESA